LPLVQSDNEGNLPIHVIANQLMILEGLKKGPSQPSNYEAAVLIAQKIVGG
jgi:hypothetical protein